MLGHKLLQLIRYGELTVTGPDGRRRTFVGSREGPRVGVRIRDAGTEWRLALHPDLYLGEAYMNGTLVLEEGSIRDLLDLCGRNLRSGPTGRTETWLLPVLRLVQQWNGRADSLRHVAHHYDLDEALYRTFLDADLQYSCAYFPVMPLGLEDAQRAKKDHIAAKLLLKPGMRVLDIGCGWGGLALHLAENFGVDVEGVTLSREQLAVCQTRAAAKKLSRRVSFKLLDYRDITGNYDRIVFVGMFEHVGIPNFGRFFEAIAEHLKETGVALVHSIGRAHGPSYTSSWTRKYIFPGGYAPALSEVLPKVERSGLWLTDLEILRSHYAETLRIWRNRFLQASPARPPGLNERFVRMWDFYLASSEMAFRHHGLMVFQLQLSREPVEVPLTRDHIYAPKRTGTPESLSTGPEPALKDP